MIEDYIIDLGLEFGIRTKLAVLVIKQFETKREREKGGVLLSLRWPLLFLMAGQTPPPEPHLSLAALHLLPHLHHHAQPPSSQNPQFSVSPARKSQGFAFPSSNQRYDAKSGQIQRQPNMVSIHSGCDSSTQTRAEQPCS